MCTQESHLTLIGLRTKFGTRACKSMIFLMNKFEKKKYLNQFFSEKKIKNVIDFKNELTNLSLC